MWQKLQNYVAEPQTFPPRECREVKIFVPREEGFVGNDTHLRRKSDLGHRKRQTPIGGKPSPFHPFSHILLLRVLW